MLTPFYARLKRGVLYCLDFWPGAMMLIGCLVIAVHLADSGWNLFAAILVGALYSVTGTYVFGGILYSILGGGARSVSFRQGDCVKVIDGPHMGATGIVESKDSRRSCVKVILTITDEEDLCETFQWEQVRKIKQNDKVNCSSNTQEKS